MYELIPDDKKKELENLIKNESFQEMLYVYYNKPKRDIRAATIPYAEIFYIHGNLLFELKRLPEAREYLKKALGVEEI